MADEITVPHHITDIVRIGVYSQLESNVPMIKEFNGTVDEAIDHYEMRKFIENNIAVISTERAYNTQLIKILNEETFNGAYAHLVK